MGKSRRVEIDGSISDLFFNLDLSFAEVMDGNGQFQGYDDAKLAQEAEWFLVALSDLGVDTPSVSELLADFRERL